MNDIALMAWLIAAFVLLFLFVILGPRPTINPNPRARTDVPSDPQQLSQWIQQLDQGVTNLVDGAEKHIEWANPKQPTKTRYSILYLHGLSACRQELSPIPENVAASIGANLYLTRLPGHGADYDEMARADADDWIDETWRSWQVAEQLGEQVIIMATSTGATLTTWLLQQQGVQDKVSCCIFVSPNFGPNRKHIDIITWPWAETWVPWIFGPEHCGVPLNEEQAKYWVTCYPMHSVHQMVALVHWAKKQQLEHLKTPVLWIFSDFDLTVNPELTKAVMARWGGPSERMEIPFIEGSNNHVIAGDIVMPENNDLVINRIQEYLEPIVNSKPG